MLLILQVGDTIVLLIVAFVWTGDTAGGTNDGGSFLGRVILLRLRTTKCMASLNSANESAPSLVTSDNSLEKIKNKESQNKSFKQIYHISLSSCNGKRDFSKNDRAIEPANKDFGLGCIDANCSS